MYKRQTETYGRVSKWGAYALLARLYLNAEIYTGQARWDDSVSYTHLDVYKRQFLNSVIIYQKSIIICYMHFMTLLWHFKALFNSLRPINIAVE